MDTLFLIVLGIAIIAGIFHVLGIIDLSNYTD